MRLFIFNLFLFSFFISPLFAEGAISFTLDGKTYSLADAKTAFIQKGDKSQLIIGVTDRTARVQFALTVESPMFTTPQQFTTSSNSISLTVLTTKGMYSVVPEITFARDDFMRYNRRKEVETGEMEDDPNDTSDNLPPECRTMHNTLQLQTAAHKASYERCEKRHKTERKKRKKIRVEYVQEPPTWVNKTREERLRTGDGVMREEQYRDTFFQVNLTPTLVDGKITQLTGSFGGTVRFAEGQFKGRTVTLSTGSFTVPVTYSKN
ncbi:MAG TPA: hypothetical protein PLY93_07785 [Turneriella sp.]|nr:hypothetical protein [Turneriella sp.]